MSWRPLVGYEGLYEMSEAGEVNCLGITLPDGRQIRGRNVRKTQSPSGPYCHLYDRGGRRRYRSLRLLHGRTFLEAECAPEGTEPSTEPSHQSLPEGRRGAQLSPQRKLDPEQVREIYTLCADPAGPVRTGILTLEKLAKQFGVSRRTVYQITRRHTWTAVTEDLWVKFGPMDWRTRKARSLIWIEPSNFIGGRSNRGRARRFSKPWVSVGLGCWTVTDLDITQGVC